MSLPMSLSTYHYNKRFTLELLYVPSIYECFAHMFVAMLGFDFVFYHTHGMLHHKLLYKHIHKMHHEWVSPIAPACIYAHPVEHLFSGILAPGIGIMITRPPLCTIWLWYSWTLIQTMNDHSGYHMPLVYSSEFHDFHHLR